jgi:glycosyltransferase involved in cell wall biosynthesis
LRIRWHPRYGREAASSRLRVYTIHDELQHMGHDSAIGGNSPADIVVVQKIVAIGEVKKYIEADAASVKIYDYDDTDIIPFLPQVHPLVRAFSTDTAGHRTAAEECFRWKPCLVYADPIDYMETNPQPAPATDINEAIWFGNWPNFVPALEMVQQLLQHGTPVKVVSLGLPHVPAGATYVEWSLYGMSQILQSSGFALLSHDRGDTGKSCNKMVTAIMHGLPCLVSDTPEYASLARAIEAEWTIIRSPEALTQAADRLKHREERQKYLNKAQPVVWMRYHPRRVASQFLDEVSRFL